jgi:FtsH-binding integral membrane protein
VPSRAAARDGPEVPFGAPTFWPGYGSRVTSRTVLWVVIGVMAVGLVVVVALMPAQRDQRMASVWWWFVALEAFLLAVLIWQQLR